METTGCVTWQTPAALFNVSDTEPSCIPTHRASSSVVLNAQASIWERLRAERPDFWELPMTLPDGTHDVLELHKTKAYTEDLVIGHMTATGLRTERYTPRLMSYKIGTAGFYGTLIFLDEQIVGTVRHAGIQYELGGLECDEKPTGQFVLYATSDAVSTPH